MKIGMMGFEFNSPNKGCEALTYAILNILKKIIVDNEETVILNFSGSGLGNIPDYFPEFIFVEVKPKIKDLKFEYIRKVSQCDFILDVSMGDSFSDIYGVKKLNTLMRHKKIAELFGKKYILLPQTYGPFEHLDCEKKAIQILKNANKIYCRDEISQKLIYEKYKIEQTELVSDMAFVLPYDKNLFPIDSKNRIKVGINVSGLLYKGGLSSKNQINLKLDYKTFINDLINYFTEQNNYEIHLIPHVIDLTENAPDDDYRISELLQNNFREKVVLAPKFKNPIEAKSYISHMDLFIGSRMHSTIAAFSTGVITIPLSYSRKFEGLFNSLSYNFLINGKEDDSNTAMNKIKTFISDTSELKKSQKNAYKLIEENNEKFINSLRKIMIMEG